MLYIKTATGGHEWHVGDWPFVLDGLVVEFVASGHELRWLQVAIEHGKMTADKDYYNTVWADKTICGEKTG